MMLANSATTLALICIGAAALFLGMRLWFALAHVGHLKRQLLDEQKQSQIYRIACSAARDGLVLQRLDGTIIWANAAYCDMMGYRLDEIEGRNPLSFALPADDTPSEAEIAAFRMDPDDPDFDPALFRNIRNVRKNGELFWNQLRTAIHRRFDDEDEDVVVQVCRDATDQVETENRLRKQSRELSFVAQHDTLTGAANRAGLLPFVDAALEAARTDGTPVGLLQIDLDKFKNINDTLGHAAGDMVLQHVADKARSVLRSTDMLARTGGDEFVIVCPDMPDQAALQRVGAAVCTAIHSPLTVEGRELTPGVSIGGALSGRDTLTIDSLLKRSDQALYEVKRTGRGSVHIYDNALHSQLVRTNRKSDRLRDGIANNEIMFYFQPTISLHSGEVRGFEALCRWQPEPGRILRPADFLHLAKNIGLMAKIDMRAVEAVCGIKRALEDADFRHIRVGANVSRAFLAMPDTAQVIESSITSHNLQASGLVLEVAADAVFRPTADRDDVRQRVGQLHDMGFAILIDNFGADYADLLEMEKLRISGFKTSTALTAGLTTNTISQRIAAMVGEVADDLGLYGVHVGVETRDDLATLAALGAGVVQGNFLAPPMPASDVIAFLQGHDKQAVLQQAGLDHQLPPPEGIAI